MTFVGDGRREAALEVPIFKAAEDLGLDLKFHTMTERTGPCPSCGGNDRFCVMSDKAFFRCRICGAGGDVIALVQFVHACGFREALSFLVGEAPAALDPVEIERRRVEREKRAAAEAEKRERYRAWAIRDAREIWHAAEGHDTAPAEAYLAGRGIVLPAWPPTLRFLPDHPCTRRSGGETREHHRGPCMIAAVQDPRGKVTAVHQTWIDPARPGRKAEIRDVRSGEALPAKMVRGSKKGGAIRLTPRPPKGGTLIMGEGIETTLSGLQISGLEAAAWAGVDLGNMAGRQVREPGTRNSGVPDMDDAEAFLPPPWIGKLVFLQDGDSEASATRAKLTAGLRRAMIRNPDLAAEIVPAPAGLDFNDLINPHKRDIPTDDHD